MKFADLKVQACLKLQRIPAHLEEHINSGAKPNVHNTLRQIVYVQQSYIETLERALMALAELSPNPNAIHLVREILESPQEPLCGDEPEDPDLDVEPDEEQT